MIVPRMISELANTIELQLLLLRHTLRNQTIIRKTMINHKKKEKETNHPCLLKAGNGRRVERRKNGA